MSVVKEKREGRTRHPRVIKLIPLFNLSYGSWVPLVRRARAWQEAGTECKKKDKERKRE